MIVCPDCHSELPSLDVDVCTACGFAVEHVDGIPVLLSGRDRQAPLFQEYLAAYDAIAADDLEASIQPTPYLELKAERFFSDLGDLEGKRVLEVGVGQGMLFERMLQAGAREVVGVDIAAAYLHPYFGRDRARVAVANVENLPFVEQFDLIVASDVLEHVLSLPDALVSIHRALAPGGRLIVDLPYRENLLQYARLLGCRYELVHLRTFDRRAVVDLLSDAGFSVQRVAYDGFLAGRERPFVGATQTGTRLYKWFVARRYGGPSGVPSIGRHLGRALIRPVTIIAVARRRAGVQHPVIPPIRYVEQDAADR
jgi:SAM-dependent methyltransferase